MTGVGQRPYPAAEIAEVYRRLLLYTEHTYGMTEWGWEHTTLIESKGEMAAPAFDDSKAGWEEKKDHAYWAHETSERLLGDQLEELSSSVQTDAGALLVLNPLSWQRTDLAYLRWRRAPELFLIIDRRTGNSLSHQVVREDHRFRLIAFPVEDIPPLQGA